MAMHGERRWADDVHGARVRVSGKEKLAREERERERVSAAFLSSGAARRQPSGFDDDAGSSSVATGMELREEDNILQKPPWLN